MRYDTIIPFYKVYTLSDIVSKADIASSYTYNATALYFGAGFPSYGLLFKLPLLKKNLLSVDADIVVVATIGLDSGVRSGDSDPKFFVSDELYGVGFEMREEADRCQGMKAIMGSTALSMKTFPGANHNSSIPPEQFVLTIKNGVHATILLIVE